MLSKAVKSSLSVALAAMIATVQLPAAGVAAKSDGAATSAPGRDMTTEELYQLYHGRSWIWKDGAGYFRVSKREFSAWSGRKSDMNYGEGRWFLTSGGRLCFRADWTARSGTSNALTCFAHRIDGRKVYQRRLPDGDWYVFRNSPMRAGDEAAKLKPGNYAAKGVARAKAQLGRN